MDFTDYIAGTDDEEKRLDKVLSRIFETCISVNYHQALRKKLIKLNGAKAEGASRLQKGDRISIASFLLEKNIKNQYDKTTHTQTIQLSTIFKNNHIWIINKERGINVQPSSKSATSIAEEVKKQSESTSLSFIPAPLHRLDKNTSGVLAISQSTKGARWFSQEIQCHNITKKYIGISLGHLLNEEVWIDSIDDTSNDNDVYKTVKQGTDEDKIAKTIATPLCTGVYKGKKISLVLFNIETGRKHQIRFQSWIHNHPLLGDSAYNKEDEGSHFFLHAIQMIFPKDNPINVPESVIAPIPKDFEDIIKLSFPNFKLENIKL